MLLRRRCIGTFGYMGGVFAVPELFCWSWGQLIAYNYEAFCKDGEYVHMIRSPMSFHAAARNYLVGHMLGDWLLMLDTDHEFPPDLCHRMVEAMYYYRVPVITGVYRHKSLPHGPVLYHYWEDKDIFAAIAEWDAEVKAFQVDSAGAGVLLIHGSVLERIEKDLNERPFDIRPGYSEDVSFFLRLRELNITTFCLTGAEANHLIMSPITAKHYDPDYLQASWMTEVHGVGG